MVPISIHPKQIRFGPEFALSFHRTLRLPDDGRSYPLPPSLGRLPISPVADLGDRAPETFRDRGGAFIVMHRREALWLGFEGPGWPPCAVKVGVGRINALDGKPWDEELRAGRGDYLVAPPQLWIDGIKTGNGRVRQFVVTTLGQGDTIEGQVSGEEQFGGIQVVVYKPRPGRFPKEPPDRGKGYGGRGGYGGGGDGGYGGAGRAASAPPAGLGVAAGGMMEQKLYPDPYGIETWDPENRASMTVHILDVARYHELTGNKPPPSPIDARTYTEYGFPWFDLYDEGMGDLPTTDTLAGVRSLRERDEERGDTTHPDPESVDVPPEQILKEDVPEV